MKLTALLLAATLVAGSRCGTTSSTLVEDNLENKVGSAEVSSDKLVKTVDPHYVDEDGRTGVKEEYQTKEGQLVKTEIIAGNPFNTYHDIITYDRLGRVKTESHVWIEDHMTRKSPSAEKSRWFTIFTYRDDGYVQKTTLSNTGKEHNVSYNNDIDIKLMDSNQLLVKGLTGPLTSTGTIIKSNIFTFEYDPGLQQKRIVNEEHIKKGRLVSTGNQPDENGNILYDNDPNITYTKDVQLMHGRKFYPVK